MAQPIDLSFQLSARVGRRKQKFNRIRQMTPMCTISIVFARWRQCTYWRQSAVSGAKTAEPIDLSFGLWIGVGRRKLKFNRIRQCAHMGGHIGATWRIRLNRPSAAAMRSYVKLLWPLVSITKNKFHYDSWFKAGRRQVRSWSPTSFESDSVIEFGLKQASNITCKHVLQSTFNVADRTVLMQPYLTAQKE